MTFGNIRVASARSRELPTRYAMDHAACDACKRQSMYTSKAFTVEHSLLRLLLDQWWRPSRRLPISRIDFESKIIHVHVIFGWNREAWCCERRDSILSRKSYKSVPSLPVLPPHRVLRSFFRSAPDFSNYGMCVLHIPQNNGWLPAL